jgi:hypothetical protein
MFYKREVATLKENGEMKFTEGKQPMSFRVYEYLARKALSSVHDFPLNFMAHTFLLFSWNLMARSGIMYDRVTWEEDSLVISISKLKNDQEGQNYYP